VVKLNSLFVKFRPVVPAAACGKGRTTQDQPTTKQPTTKYAANGR
jgi:hypothetical protein